MYRIELKTLYLHDINIQIYLVCHTSLILSQLKKSFYLHDINIAWSVPHSL